MDFREAEVRFSELQRSLRQKAITEETFRQEVSKLMVQDADGKYWAVDPGSGAWLYYNGQTWAPALPPTVHTQVNKVVRRRDDRWLVVLGVGTIVLLCGLAALLVLVLRPFRGTELNGTSTPPMVMPTVVIEFTVKLETPTSARPIGTPEPVGTVAVPAVMPSGTPDCQYDAEFVSDVTISDGQSVKPDQRFNKIWRLRNTGTCAWVGFTWAYVSGEHMGGPDSVGVRRTEPGDTVDISVPLYSEADTGTYAGIWQLRDPNGHGVGENATVRVVIVAAPTATPTASPTPSPSPTPTVRPSVDFRVDEDVVDAGQCTTLRWDLENVQAVYLDDQGVVGHSSKSVCPAHTTQYKLCWAHSSVTDCRTITVDVNEPSGTPSH